MHQFFAIQVYTPGYFLKDKKTLIKVDLTKADLINLFEQSNPNNPKKTYKLYNSTQEAENNWILQGTPPKFSDRIEVTDLYLSDIKKRVYKQYTCISVVYKCSVSAETNQLQLDAAELKTNEMSNSFIFSLNHTNDKLNPLVLIKKKDPFHFFKAVKDHIQEAATTLFRNSVI